MVITSIHIIMVNKSNEIMSYIFQDATSHFYSNKCDECEYEYNPSVQFKRQWLSPKIFMNLQLPSMLLLVLLIVALQNIQGKSMTIIRYRNFLEPDFLSPRPVRPLCPLLWIQNRHPELNYIYQTTNTI